VKTAAIVSVLPSFYFAGAVVIETDCDHSHLRPRGLKPYAVGDDFDCPFEHDDGTGMSADEKAWLG
jgi:hypothetical protein